MGTKKLLVVFLFIFSVVSGTAQITEVEKKLKSVDTDTIIGWKKGAVASVNLAQTALVNWSVGGQNSIAVNGMFSGFINYKNRTTAWDNSLDLGYGLLKQGEQNRFLKTDDRIDFLSKYGKKAFSNFYYAGIINFKTQISSGYNYPNDSVKISGFLAPAYVLGAVGLNYIPNSYFNAFVAPLTGKMTIVSDKTISATGAYGVTPGKMIRNEFGGYIRAIYSRSDFKSGFLKNVAFTSKIDLFSNYLNDPQNIDVNWENLIALKVNKYISVNINTQLIYDADIKYNNGPAKIQFKEILGVGLSFKL